jgi:multiple sugar transport system permease protein
MRINRVYVEHNRGLSNKSFAILLILPSAFVIGFVIIYPLLNGLILSLKSYNIIEPDSIKFIFFKNYEFLFIDKIFWESFKNTIVFIFFSILGGFTIGLSLALVLNQKIVFQRFFRGIALTPWVVPGVIVSLLFFYMFNGEVGIINYVLKKMHLISEFIPWFGKQGYAMFAVIFANIWNQFPFYMLMFLAALQAIPEDINEAAVIDGTNVLQKFFYITLPYLKNVMLITTTLMVIWNFNNFDIIWGTTQGGPVNATTTFAIYSYRMAFRNFELGYASTIGVIWLIMLLIFSFFYIKNMERKSIE